MLLIVVNELLLYITPFPFRTPFGMESEILGLSETQNNSDTNEGKTNKKEINVPAPHLITSLICGHQHSLHHVETKLKELL